MSDYRRCRSAEPEKNYKNLFTAGRSIKNVPRHLRQIQCQAMLIYHLVLQILPKVSKTVGILAKTLKN